MSIKKLSIINDLINLKIRYEKESLESKDLSRINALEDYITYVLTLYDDRNTGISKSKKLSIILSEILNYIFEGNYIRNEKVREKFLYVIKSMGKEKDIEIKAAIKFNCSDRSIQMIVEKYSLVIEDICLKSMELIDVGEVEKAVVEFRSRSNSLVINKVLTSGVLKLLPYPEENESINYKALIKIAIEFIPYCKSFVEEEVDKIGVSKISSVLYSLTYDVHSDLKKRFCSEMGYSIESDIGNIVCEGYLDIFPKSIEPLSLDIEEKDIETSLSLIKRYTNKEIKKFIKTLDSIELKHFVYVISRNDDKYVLTRLMIFALLRERMAYTQDMKRLNMYY